MLKKIETMPTPKERVAKGLFEKGLVKFGDFTLTSGIKSPIYIDLRELVGYPALLTDVALVLEEAFRMHYAGIERIAAVPYGAMPLATALSIRTGLPMIYLRKEVKEHGTRKQVEGPYNPGEQVLIIEDLFTTGGSAVVAARILEEHELDVMGALALIDRRSKWTEFQYPLQAAFSLQSLLEIWQAAELITEEQLKSVREFEEAQKENR